MLSFTRKNYDNLDVFVDIYLIHFLHCLSYYVNVIYNTWHKNKFQIFTFFNEILTLRCIEVPFALSSKKLEQPIPETS